MNILIQQYLASTTAAAANVAPATLQNWLKRKLIVGHRDEIEGGGVQGKHRHFSFNAMMQIAVANALLDASGGMEIKAALDAAMVFAHSGDEKRLPGHPYHYKDGDTFLATYGGRTAILTKVDDDFVSQILEHLAQPPGFVVVNVSKVFQRVCAVLDVHPYDVLDAAYA